MLAPTAALSTNTAEWECSSSDEWFSLIKSGCVEDLVALQERGLPFVLPFDDKEGNSPFHAAAVSGNIKMFKYMMSIYSEYDSPHKKQNSKGESPLLLAVMYNHLPMISYLLSNGSSLDEKDIIGNTSLHLAAANGHLQCVQWLVAHGCSIEYLNSEGCTCLSYAAKNYKFETITWLFEQGCPIPDASRYGSCLLEASEAGNLEVVKCLLSQGCSVNSSEEYGSNCLLYAVEGQHLEIVKHLVDNGCDLEEKDKETASKEGGNTAVLLAAAQGDWAYYYEIVQYLLEHGCSFEVKGKFQRNVLHWAAIFGEVQCVQWLLDHGCLLNEKDDYGYTSLHLAARYSDENFERIYLHGWSDTLPLAPFCQEEYDNHVAVIQLLLDAGASTEGIFPPMGHSYPFIFLETLINYVGISVEEVKAHCSEKHFSAFMEEMRRKKTNKRVSP